MMSVGGRFRGDGLWDPQNGQGEGEAAAGALARLEKRLVS